MRLIDVDEERRKVEQIPYIVNENKAFHEGCRYMQKKVLWILHEAKTVEAEPVKHGRWEHKLFDEKYSIWLYHCSACGGVSAQKWNYCRECGAKMDLVGEKNERV